MKIIGFLNSFARLILMMPAKGAVREFDPHVFRVADFARFERRAVFRIGLATAFTLLMFVLAPAEFVGLKVASGIILAFCAGLVSAWWFPIFKESNPQKSIAHDPEEEQSLENDDACPSHAANDETEPSPIRVDDESANGAPAVAGQAGLANEEAVTVLVAPARRVRKRSARQKPQQEMQQDMQQDMQQSTIPFEEESRHDAESAIQ